MIEDDPDVQKMVVMALRFTGGHEVEPAGDGAAGIDRAARWQPDLILLDVMMPDMDGHETCRRLKADPATAAMPVVFLSARAQAAEIEEGRRLGAIGYLVKPFDPMTLNDRLWQILHEARRPAAPEAGR